MKKIVWLLREKSNKRDEYSPSINWWYGILENLGYNVIYYPYETYDATEFIPQMKEYKPDFIFHSCYDLIHPEFEELKSTSKVYAVQSDDDWRFDFAKDWSPYIEANIGYAGKLERYLEAGIPEEKYIPTKWGFNPNTMLIDKNLPKDILLSHAGGLHADRVKLLNEFKLKGINPQFPPSKCFYEQIKELWKRSKYSLCFTKNSVMTGTQVKGRVSEIPYFTVLLSQGFDGIEEYYEPNKEFILFETIDEAIKKIKYYENNPAEYSKIYEAGKKRLLSTGTCYHRWNNILHKIDPEYKSINVQKLLKEKHKI